MYQYGAFLMVFDNQCLVLTDLDTSLLDIECCHYLLFPGTVFHPVAVGHLQESAACLAHINHIWIGVLFRHQPASPAIYGSKFCKPNLYIALGIWYYNNLKNTLSIFTLLVERKSNKLDRSIYVVSFECMLRITGIFKFSVNYVYYQIK